MTEVERKLGYLKGEETVEVMFSAREIMTWIEEDDARLDYFRHNLLDEEDRPEPLTMTEQITSMPSIERDAFLADLARECALLGIEWPADPRAETQRITK